MCENCKCEDLEKSQATDPLKETEKIKQDLKQDLELYRKWYRETCRERDELRSKIESLKVIINLM